MTLKTANQHRNEWFEGVHKCKQDESLFAVMERIVKAEVHRLVVVDDENKVTGVISLSDILTYLVLRPGGKFVHCRGFPVLHVTYYCVSYLHFLQEMTHTTTTHNTQSRLRTRV